jgi:protoheme IX farnesyltransferase
MKRTCQRPLVKGFLKPNHALMIGAGLGLTGMAGLLSYNLMTGAMGLSIWAGYLFLYTRMKSRSELNTFVGSIVGSLPVYLGWAASGRSICMV